MTPPSRSSPAASRAQQLGLFEEPAPPPVVAPATPTPEVLELARRLPPNIRFGTSSWTFPGWHGLVYNGEHPQNVLARHGLHAYVQHPLLRTVGVDRSYYGPLGVEDLQDYSRVLPPGFTAVLKVWEAITLPVFPNHARYGKNAGLPNPHFLDPAVFAQEVLAPLQEAFWSHVGALVLEFSPMTSGAWGGDAVAFSRRLDGFLGALEPGLPLAVELRNPELFTPRHLHTLAAHGVAHVYNRWSRMPAIGAQLQATGAPQTPHVVARIMLPPGRSYEERKTRCAPFHELVDVDLPMRQDVARLALAVLGTPRTLLVIVNNKAEGSAPRTVEALAAQVVAALP